MKLILKKFIVILLIICILVPSLFSGFVLADDMKIILTQERAGNYIASFAINFFDNWSNTGYIVGNGGSNNTLETTGNGEYGVPLKNMRVNSEYAELRDGEPHLGTDLGGDYGDEIFACHSGEVIQVFNGCSHDSNLSDTCGNGYGNHVRILDSNGITIIYGHMKQNSITVKQGQIISQGEKIGEMGSSGSSTGKHLHLEFRTSDTNLLKNMNEGTDYHWSSKKNAYTINPRKYIDFGSSAEVSSSGTSSPNRVVKRGEVSTKYDENAKVTDIVESDKNTYIFSNESWINFVYKYSISMSETTLSSMLTNFDTEDKIFENKLVKSGDIIDITKLVNEGNINPGDILYVSDGKGGGQYLLYIGGTKVMYATPPYKETPEDETNGSAIRQEYLQYYLDEIRRNLVEGHEDEEDYDIPQYGVTKVYRIKQSYLEEKKLTQDDVDMTFNKKGYYSDSQYEGIPPEIKLEKTEEVGFKWIFDGIAGIFELLLNTIIYVIRMQVIGWANMFELAIQSVILGISRKLRWSNGFKFLWTKCIISYWK